MFMLNDRWRIIALLRNNSTKLSRTGWPTKPAARTPGGCYRYNTRKGKGAGLCSGRLLTTRHHYFSDYPFSFFLCCYAVAY